MPESAVHRYLEGSASLLERWKIDSTRLSRYTAEEILELAKEGNVVIRGWGATALLREIPHVLCVRVCAPMAFRERVMMERLGINDASVVRREIERNDAAHARTMHRLFDLDWEDPLLYHLVLNTESVAIETCVKLVRALAESPALQETEESRSVIADKLLETRVRALLSVPLGIGAGFTGIEATARKGKVTLAGVTSQSQSAAEIERLVRGVAGVTEVENRIVVVRPRAGSV
jgi:cytidylate kinase